MIIFGKFKKDEAFVHILSFFANPTFRRQNMKEFMTIIGFGAGLITGALLYKHSQETKQLVNKTEKAVKKEMDMMKDKVEPKLEKTKKDMKKEIKKMADNL